MGATLGGEPTPGDPVSVHADYFFGIWVVEDDLARTTLRFIGPKNRMCLLASTFSVRTGDLGKMYGQSHLGEFVAMFEIVESKTMKEYYSLEVSVKRLTNWQRGFTATRSFVDWVTQNTKRSYDLLQGTNGKIVLRDVMNPSSEWTLHRVIGGLGLELGSLGRAYVDRNDFSTESPGTEMKTVGPDGEECTFIVPEGDDDIIVHYIPRHSVFLKPEELMTDDEIAAKIIIERNMRKYVRYRKTITAEQWREKVDQLSFEPRRRRRRPSDLQQVMCLRQGEASLPSSAASLAT